MTDGGVVNIMQGTFVIHIVVQDAFEYCNERLGLTQVGDLPCFSMAHGQNINHNVYSRHIKMGPDKYY